MWVLFLPTSGFDFCWFLGLLGQKGVDFRYGRESQMSRSGGGNPVFGSSKIGIGFLSSGR